METNEFVTTHASGFGGSDSRMFYRLSLGGVEALTKGDKVRIAQVKGLLPVENQVGISACDAGHDFEDFFAKDAAASGIVLEREVRLTKRLATNFETFCHADFVVNGKEVIELKHSKNYLPRLCLQYYHQLQWYYIMGATMVKLVTNHQSCNGYDAMDILIDYTYCDKLLRGVRLLDDAWESPLIVPNISNFMLKL